jgi:hypothetical protein
LNGQVVAVVGCYFYRFRLRRSLKVWVVAYAGCNFKRFRGRLKVEDVIAGG